MSMLFLDVVSCSDFEGVGFFFFACDVLLDDVSDEVSDNSSCCFDFLDFAFFCCVDVELSVCVVRLGVFCETR